MRELVVLDLDHQAVPGQPQPHGDEAGSLLVGVVDHALHEPSRGFGHRLQQHRQRPFGQREAHEHLGAVQGAGQGDETKIVDLRGVGAH
ncbi:hypothetical protein ACFSVJ_02090 [Prauserella oleivorans]